MFLGMHVLAMLSLSLFRPLGWSNLLLCMIFYFSFLYPHHDTTVVIAAFLNPALTLGGCVAEAYWVPSAILGCVSTTILPLLIFMRDTSTP